MIGERDPISDALLQNILQLLHRHPEVVSQFVHAGREGYWGLSGMRERAETIGAKLNVWSKATAGTESEIARPRSQPFQISDFKLCL